MIRLLLYVGEYLGLTGARLNGKELVAAGLATHFVPLEVSPRDKFLFHSFLQINCKSKLLFHGLETLYYP